MQQDRVLMMTGLAQKAGKIASGSYQVERAVKEGRAKLVIAAGDASENTKKKLRNMTAHYHTEMIVYGTKDLLSKCLGRDSRSAAAVLSEEFAAEIRRRFEETTTE